MGKETGILLEQSGDLDVKVIRDKDGKIVNGLQVGDATKQNINSILVMHPGELKENPIVGVGISSMLMGHDTLLYKHKIRRQLDVEGMQVDQLEISGSEIKINANYR